MPIFIIKTHIFHTHLYTLVHAFTRTLIINTLDTLRLHAFYTLLHATFTRFTLFIPFYTLFFYITRFYII